jgi:hypothetical protein
VRGSGDGGAYSTVADVAALWRALHDGRIVPPDAVAELLRPRSAVPSAGAGRPMRYGLGFWRHVETDAAMLVGSDAGVSFRTVHRPSTGTTHTVVSNTSRGAWPLTRELDRLLDT